MNKEYTCASCGSKANGTPGTCCGAERKEVTSHVCLACQTSKGEHDHHAKEGAGTCSSCQAGAGAHTCGA